ncbi:DUF3102 domain-containing protein [Myxosarcina sp. GI1]|uniref:DUF3102 domain-containing protein n=1 Tax=Myxosarcina sp. GI1 TaxID=1541065 RepID=UPI0006911027|nr:DUF3102 domain-containing protein [Myxosarcina sp. GI1]
MSLLEAPKIPFRGKILYVDDEVSRAETDRQVFTLKARLRTEDLLFADAFNNALEILDKHLEISTVLVDLRIPERSEDTYDYDPQNPDREWGEKLIETIIQKYSQKRKIYIIVVSAYTTYVYNSRDSSSPVLAFYSKPIDFDKLIENFEFIINDSLKEKSSLFLKPEEDSSSSDGFNYTSLNLDEETLLFVRDRTVEIKKLIRRTAQDIVDIGKYLTEVKDKLGHGNFYNWLDVEFNWSYSTAARFMQVAERFKSVSLTDLNILQSALYQLAAPTTPEGATVEALERAKQGEIITEKLAKEIKLKHKEQKKVNSLENELPSKDLQLESQKSQHRNRISSSPQSKLEPKQSVVAVIPTKKAVLNSWWQIGNYHRLFCGNPKDNSFLSHLPKKIQLTVTLPPNNNNSLIPKIKAKSDLLFRSELNDIDPLSILKMIEHCLGTTTEGNDIVVISYIPTPRLLELIDTLGCNCYVAEPDLEKCDRLLSIWRDKVTVSRLSV